MRHALFSLPYIYKNDIYDFSCFINNFELMRIYKFFHKLYIFFRICLYTYASCWREEMLCVLFKTNITFSDLRDSFFKSKNLIQFKKLKSL